MRPAPTGVTLLLGGARCGKSDLAVRLGRAWDGDVTLVVTAESRDDDMAARIERHQADRPSDWTLVEAAGFCRADLDRIDTTHLVIVDCLTMLAANLMLGGTQDDAVVDHIGDVVAGLAGRLGPSVVVSNEVGSGVHPATDLGRQYRDLLGRVNRTASDRAAATYLVVAGGVIAVSPMDVTW